MAAPRGMYKGQSLLDRLKGGFVSIGWEESAALPVEGSSTGR